MPESLHQLHADLHQERVNSWDPEYLAVNVDQRRLLVENFDPAKIFQVGNRLDDFTLLDVNGSTLWLAELVTDAPAVLIFFRFAGCPACNIALPYYQRTLWPMLEQAGIRLIAVSPQVPERLGEIREVHGLDFTVASDPDNRLARHLGIVFESTAATKAYAEHKGIDLPALIGTGTWELPQPTVVVIDQDQVVRYIDVSPDWLVRTESPAILEAAQAVAHVPA